MKERKRDPRKKVEPLACSRRHVLKFQADLEWKERGSNERRDFLPRSHREQEVGTFSGRISVERLSLESAVITLPRVIKDADLNHRHQHALRFIIAELVQHRLLKLVCVTN